jgi:hypothetical protein
MTAAGYVREVLERMFGDPGRSPLWLTVTREEWLERLTLGWIATTLPCCHSLKREPVAKAYTGNAADDYHLLSFNSVDFKRFPITAIDPEDL